MKLSKLLSFLLLLLVLIGCSTNEHYYIEDTKLFLPTDNLVVDLGSDYDVSEDGLSFDFDSNEAGSYHPQLDLIPARTYDEIREAVYPNDEFSFPYTYVFAKVKAVYYSSPAQEGCQVVEVFGKVYNLIFTNNDCTDATAKEVNLKFRDFIKTSIDYVDVNQLGVVEGKPDQLRFSGPHFDVNYPKEFRPIVDSDLVVLQAGRLVRGEDDAASFASPDGSVEFFVFAPWRSGNTEGYLAVANNEVLVATETKSKLINETETVLNYTTIKAQDGSYYRSYVEYVTRYSDGIVNNHLFGIKYKDQASYKQYVSKYEEFKKSLAFYEY
jgi:hypothetical protein